MMKIKRGEFWSTIFCSVGRTDGRSNFHGDFLENGNHEFSRLISFRTYIFLYHVQSCSQ